MGVVTSSQAAGALTSVVPMRRADAAQGATHNVGETFQANKTGRWRPLFKSFFNNVSRQVMKLMGFTRFEKSAPPKPLITLTDESPVTKEELSKRIKELSKQIKELSKNESPYVKEVKEKLEDEWQENHSMTRPIKRASNKLTGHVGKAESIELKFREDDDYDPDDYELDYDSDECVSIDGFIAMNS